MRRKIIFCAAILILVFRTGAAAQERYIPGIPQVTTTEEKNYGGVVVVTPTLQAGFRGEKAKFNEYRDLGDRVFGAIGLRYDGNRYYLDFGAADMGYKTQTYGLEGGWWGVGRFHLSYDELPHNFTFGARSPYSGIGGTVLTLPPAPPNVVPPVSSWNTFDYSLERKKSEAGFKIDVLKPFYFDVQASKIEKKGLFPIGVSATSPGGAGIELPMPISYTTDDIKFEAGYGKNPLFLSLSYYYSKFDNGNNNLLFTNVASAPAAGLDAFTLPRDNYYQKINLKGAVKLPYNSKFNMDIAVAHTESDSNLLTSYLNNAAVRTPITLSKPDFNGDLDTQNYAFALTTSPLYWLDGKLFYKYYRRENDSSQITTFDGAATLLNPLFEYYKEQGGVQVGFTLPAKFYVTTAYTRAYTKRDRHDIPKDWDDIAAVDVRWTRLDWMVARAGYELLHRRAEFTGDTLGALEPFLRRFDVAGQDRHTYKATLDFFPIENLSLTVGGKYRHANYQDAVLGLQRSTRGQFNLDVDYLLFKRMRLFANFDYERAKFDQQQRQVSSATPAGAFDPSTPPVVLTTPTPPAGEGTGNFNWTASTVEKNYYWGLGTEIYVLPNRLTLRFQYSEVRSDGAVDFSYLMPAGLLNTLAPGRTNDNIDVDNWDKYRLRYFLAKATYNFTKNLSTALAYAYERYKYDDAQYNGYLFLPTSATGTTLDFLTGAYADPNYEAHLIFLSAAYKF